MSRVSSSSSALKEQTVEKRLYTEEEWNKLLERVELSSGAVNELVMNFLVVEGYKDAAEQFSRESNTQSLPVDLEEISDRMKVREAIQQGRISESIEIVNELDPEILDSDPELMFHLRQQQLIELIRNNKIDDAITFAQNQILPDIHHSQEFVEELEKAMALLAFEEADIAGSPAGELFSTSHRQKTANRVNSAILTSQCQEKESKLPTLLKMLKTAQDNLSEKAIFPIIDLSAESMHLPIGGNNNSKEKQE